jgi:flavin-dependent dehydrogenase
MMGRPRIRGTIGYCLSGRREPLDSILLKGACVAQTVDFMERTNAGDVVWNGDRVVGVPLADDRSQHAEIVVGADGRHSLVARKVTPAVEHAAPPYRALYYLADAIVDRLRGSADERTALTGYHERRNAHGLSAYQDTVRFAADLRQLES